MSRKKHYKQEDMFPLIEQWEASGLTQQDFCNQRGITKSVFCYWVKKYRNQPGIAERFIPISVKTGNGQNGIEIYYPNGVRLSLQTNPDFSTLKRLIELF